MADFADEHPVDTSKLNDIFLNKYGRLPSQSEWSYIHSYQNTHQTGLTPETAAGLLGNIYSSIESEINKTGKALGKNLTPQQVSAVRDSVFDPGDPTNASVDFTDGTAITNAVNNIRPLIQANVINGTYQDPNAPVGDAAKADVNNLFQTTFNRAPTADELDYFGKQIAGGNTSLYEIRQSLQTHPEFLQLQAKNQETEQTQKADSARQALNTQLLESENQAFSRATPDIISSFMRAGRLGSSGLESALAKARADLASKRQDFLANAAYQQSVSQGGYNQQNFVNGQNQGFQSYLRDSAPSYNTAAYQAQLPYQSLNQYGARSNELQDYYTQQNDYSRYLQDQREQQSQSDRYELLGAGIGAGLNGISQGIASRGGR